MRCSISAICSAPNKVSGPALRFEHHATDFLQALKATKDISVVGITDSLSIANYEQLIRGKTDARFGSKDLLIPNIEFRVTPQTGATL